MKKVLGLFLLCIPMGVPLFFYLVTAGIAFDVYMLSMICGVVAYMLVCNQLILATRPALLVHLFGQKGLNRLHSHIPVVILLLAGVHPLLKELSGFTEATIQARLGTSALVIMISVIVFTIALMANTIWMKIPPLQNIKKWVYGTTGLNYHTSRTIHNLLVVAVLILAAHVMLASTSNFTTNPFGSVWMIGWLLFSLGLYIRYMVSGRHAAVKKTAETPDNTPISR